MSYSGDFKAVQKCLGAFLLSLYLEGFLCKIKRLFIFHFGIHENHSPTHITWEFEKFLLSFLKSFFASNMFCSSIYCISFHVLYKQISIFFWGGETIFENTINDIVKIADCNVWVTIFLTVIRYFIQKPFLDML